MPDIVMPAMGMAMTEGTLLRWFKQPGDPVAVGEAVAEIETDKATADVESTAEGVIGELLCGEGDSVPTGTAIARVVAEGQPVSVVAPARVAATAESAMPHDPPVIEADPPPATAVAGNGASPAVQLRPRPPLLDRSALPEVEPPALAPGQRFERVGAALDAPQDDDELRPLSIESLHPDVVREWLEAMVLIREFEDACDPLALRGKIPGGMHSAAGQEAVAVGVVRALTPTDIVTSSHRSHHHSLAKGIRPAAVMAELYGKAGGCLHGRAGHMHLADFSIGLFGSNGVVGAGLGLAMGAALAAKMRDEDQVAVGFFGDGGANTGRTWEHVNLAAIWDLPLIAVCENNLYAVETHARRSSRGQSIADRASGFGLHVVQVDGQDVVAVNRVTAEARARAVAGGGPTFVEALTYRYYGHNTGDEETYREPAEVELWRRARDPIQRLAVAMQDAGQLTTAELDEIVAAARQTVEAAVEFAEASPWPDPAGAADGVTGLPVRIRGNP